jgi:quercetin dioxygenase-like cupin family protein
MKENITAAGDGKPESFFGTILEWKATMETTDGALSLVEARGIKGAEPPIHYHEVADEFFYVLGGDMTFMVGTEIKRIGGGGFVWIPKMTTHGFAIHSDEAKFLFGFIPAGLERMFQQVDQSALLDPDAHRQRYRTIVVGPRLAETQAFKDRVGS